MKTLLRIAASLSTLVLLSTAAMALTFPTKPIADIVPKLVPAGTKGESLFSTLPVLVDTHNN